MQYSLEEKAYVQALGNAATYWMIDDRPEIDNTASETSLVFAREDK
jgi:hypothetical protein